MEIQPVACALDPASGGHASSSSSDSDGEDAGPARPAGSSMEGWIGRLEWRDASVPVPGGSALCQSLVAPGKLCRLLASIPPPAGGDGLLASAVGAACGQLREALDRAGLGIADLVSSKAYAAPGPSGAPRCSAAALQQAVADALGSESEVVPSVVPVAGAGLDAALGAWVVLEFTALRD